MKRKYFDYNFYIDSKYTVYNLYTDEMWITIDKKCIKQIMKVAIGITLDEIRISCQHLPIDTYFVP